MKTKLFLIGVAAATVSLLLSGESYAMKAMMLPEGGHVGNGGGVVVCADVTDASVIQSVELLDYYEARALREAKLDLDSLTGTWQERTQQLINRLSTVSPFRVDLYSRWLATFEKESLLMNNVQFSNIPDTGFIAVPDHCEFAQGLVQRAPRFSGDKRYFINNAFWVKMGDSQRAGLVLHEFLYREAMGYGHTDSISVRYLNAVVAEQGFSKKTQSDWVSLLTQARYEMTDVESNGIEVSFALDGEKIWGFAPKENELPLILKNRFPVRLGICNGEGCLDYSPVKLDLQSEDVVLHPMVTEMTYGENRVVTQGSFWFGPFPVTNTILLDHWKISLKINVDETQIQDVYSEPSLKGTHVYPFVLENKNKKLFMGARGIHFVGSNINSVEALFYENGEIALSAQAVELPAHQCTYHLLNLNEEGRPFYILPGKMSFGMDPAECERENQKAVVHSSFSNGTLLLSMASAYTSAGSLPVEEIISFGYQTGHYWSGGRILQLAFKEHILHYNCVIEAGCMVKRSPNSTGAGTSISSVFLLATVEVFRWNSDHPHDPRIRLSSNQVIDFYSNGVMKSGVIAADVTIRKKDDSMVSFKTGDRVTFDEEGYPITPPAE